MKQHNAGELTHVRFRVTELLDPVKQGGTLEVNKIFDGQMEIKGDGTRVVYFIDKNGQEWIFWNGITCQILTKKDIENIGTQEDRRMALARHLYKKSYADTFNEMLNDLEYESENVFRKKHSPRERYLILTKEEIIEKFKEDMLSFDRRRADTEFLAEEANMTIEEYVDDFIENDEYRDNEMLRELDRIDENYYMKHIFV